MKIVHKGYIYESIKTQAITFNALCEGNSFKKSESELRSKYIENPDGLYVTYRVEDRFGINHVHRHPNGLDTPKGIYCYTINESYRPYNGGIAIDRNHNDRYLSDVENSTTGIMYVLKMRQSANKLDSSTYSYADLDKDKITLAKLIGKELYSTEEVKGFVQNIQTKNRDNLRNTPFGLLWTYTMIYSYVNGAVDTSKWSMLLIKLGYDVIEDKGLGVIHWFEPAQTVFLKPSSYDIIDSTEYGNNNIAQINKLIELVSKNKDASNVRKNVRNISRYLMNILPGHYESEYEMPTIKQLIRETIESIDVASDAYYAALAELKPVLTKIAKNNDNGILDMLPQDISKRTYEILKDILSPYEKAKFYEYLTFEEAKALEENGYLYRPKLISRFTLEAYDEYGYYYTISDLVRYYLLGGDITLEKIAADSRSDSRLDVIAQVMSYMMPEELAKVFNMPKSQPYLLANVEKFGERVKNYPALMSKLDKSTEIYKALESSTF